MLGTYRRPRARMARLLAARPSEARLLAMAFATGLAGFAASLPDLQATAARIEADQQTDDAASAIVIARLFAAVFLVPLLFYAVAAMSHLLVRAAGGGGSFYAARVAFFWTAFMCIPLVFIELALRLFIGGMGVDIGAASGPALLALFCGYWSAHLAQAASVTSAIRVFLGIITFLSVVFVSIAAFS